ncbi:hypothetical protein D0T49_07050 [Paludibacter sp. 221]|nr:hypothetical protein [Paludibacter sp. 221]
MKLIDVETKAYFTMKSNLKFSNVFFIISLFFFFCMSSCNSKKAPVYSDFEELPDPTADTLSDWGGVKSGLHASDENLEKLAKLNEEINKFNTLTLEKTPALMLKESRELIDVLSE